MAWHGLAWLGMAWHGLAWLGMAWHGSQADGPCFDRTSHHPWSPLPALTIPGSRSSSGRARRPCAWCASLRLIRRRRASSSVRCTYPQGLEPRARPCSCHRSPWQPCSHPYSPAPLFTHLSSHCVPTCIFYTPIRSSASTYEGLLAGPKTRAKMGSVFSADWATLLAPFGIVRKVSARTRTD
jgi:hypothetical protein